MKKVKTKRFQKEDKRKICFVLLEKACDMFPRYSAGDILYTALRIMAKKNGQSVSFLRNASNRNLFKEFDLRFFEEAID